MKIKIAVILIGAFLMSCCGGKCGKPKETVQPSNAVVAAEAPAEVVAEEPVQEDQKQEEEKPKYVNGDLIMLQFSADWCGPCNMMKAALKKDKDFQAYVKKETKGYFIINIEAKDANSKAWTLRANPSSIPLVVLYKFKDGKWEEVNRFMGARSPDKVVDWLKQNKSE